MKEVLVKETRQGAESIVLKYVRCYDDKGRVVEEFSYKDGSCEVSNNDFEERTILYDGLGRVSLDVQRIVNSSGREKLTQGFQDFYHHDKDGNVLFGERYRISGFVWITQWPNIVSWIRHRVWFVEYVYDNRGRKKGEVKFRKPGKVISSTEFFYDREGVLKKARMTDTIDPFRIFHTFFDEKGREIESYMEKRGKISRRKVSEYNERGLLSKRTSFNIDGTEKCVELWSYDEEGRMTEASTLVNGVCDSKISWEYTEISQGSLDNFRKRPMPER